VQLHGRIGMTWEHPAHLYLNKAKADQLALGTAGAHRAAWLTWWASPGNWLVTAARVKRSVWPCQASK